MRIAARLDGWLIISLCLLAAWILGGIVLRGGLSGSLALVAGVLLVAVVWFYPVIGILGTIAGTCFIPFSDPLPFTNIRSINIPDLILYLLMGIVIIKTMILRNVRLVRTPLDVPLFIFAAVGIASLVVGEILNLYIFFFQAVHECKVILYYLLALIVTNIIRDKKELKFLTYGCFCIGIIVAFKIILEVWINPPQASDDPLEVFYRYSTQSAGWILSFWIFVTIVCLLFVSKVSLSHILGTVIPFFSLVLSFSRHWWISIAVAMSLIFAFNFKKNKARTFRILSFIISFVFLVIGASLLRIEPVTIFLDLITTRAESLNLYEKDQNWQIRNVENKYAVEKILSHPIFGIGFQKAYRPQIYGVGDNIESFIHNGYLWILLKMGIIGFVPFIWFSLIFIIRGIRYWDQVEDKFLKGIVLGSVCAYLGLAAANVAAPHLIYNWEVAVVGLFFGINEVIYRIQGEANTSSIDLS